MRNQHYQDQPKGVDKMTTEKRKRGRPRKVKEEPKELLKRVVTCRLNYETAYIKPVIIVELIYREQNNNIEIRDFNIASNVHQALVNFQKSLHYTRIDEQTGLKTLVANTGNLDIWLTDIEKGEAFIDLVSHIVGIVNLDLLSITYEAE